MLSINLFIHKFWFLLFFCGLFLNSKFAFSQRGRLNHKSQNWKKANAITTLNRDITFIGDSLLDAYTHLVFAYQKPFAIRSNEAGKLSIWSRDLSYRQDSLGKFNDIQELHISTDDNALAIISYDNSHTGFMVHMLDLTTFSILHQVKIGAFLDLVFTPDHSHYFILQPKNRIEMRSTVSGELLRHFVIPSYDERNLYYTNIQRILLSSANPDQLLLFDIGPAEELSLIKKGIHINLYPFDYTKQSFESPINLYFNGNPQESPPIKFKALTISEDGRYIFLGLKRKVLTYDLVEKRNNINQVVGYPSYLRCDPQSRYLIVGNDNTASLWEILPKHPIHKLRLLRQLLTKTKDLYFYDENQYLVGSSVGGHKLAFFNAKPLLSILESPSIFVQYAAQKHTKIDLNKWFESLRKKNRHKNIALDLNNSKNENYIKKLFNRNFQYYARELFNIASDYLYTPNTREVNPSVMYIYTHGFAPIEIKTSSSDFKRKEEAFLKGWYKWGKMEFGCTREHIYIKKAEATINAYPYSYDESNNKLQLSDKLSPTFENFDLNSEKLN